MATKKKLLQAAAGTAAASGGAGALNVEDVFSTYLYEGNGSSQYIDNGINLGQSNDGGSFELFGVDGDEFQVAASTDFEMGSSDFTVECFIRTTVQSGGDAIITYATAGGASNTQWGMFTGYAGATSVDFYLSNGSSYFAYTGGGNVTDGDWHHVAFCRSGSSGYLFVDGTQVGSTLSLGSTSLGNTSLKLNIGSQESGYSFNGNISNVRIVKGTALYTSNFTAPTSALTTVTNTVLLTGQGSASEVTDDNSSSSHSVVANGGVTTTSFGPFDAADAGEGGLVWVKRRSTNGDHQLHDSERGATKRLEINTGAQYTSSGITSFNANGFSLSSGTACNLDNTDHVSWTFRKAPKFFDVVTYTGNGTSQYINHNLGCEVGAIFVKRTDTAANWSVYHREQDATAPEDYYMILNLTDEASNNNGFWLDTAPTTTNFRVGSDSTVNASGGTYVAYLFAHNDGDGDFGPTGDQDIIKCGSYTGNGNNTGVFVDLGFEPQWVMIKKTSGTQDWNVIDVMRGAYAWPTTGTAFLFPNTSASEYVDSIHYLSPEANGFTVTNSYLNGGSDTYIYIAIRRGPMAVPESATDVFTPFQGQSSGGFVAGFPVDMFIAGYQPGGESAYPLIAPRLTAGNFLTTSSTATESSGSAAGNWDNMTFVGSTGNESSKIAWLWKRAPNYFDVVAYTGNGTAGRTVSHNLGVAPEMMWFKRRDSADIWTVYHSALGAGKRLKLHQSSAAEDDTSSFNNTAPASSVFTVGSLGQINGSGGTYIAYLFASLDGVSKVGSFTVSAGQSSVVDCGFSSGARFVLIKRTDGSDYWWVFDTERGITVSSSPALRLDTTLAESSDTYLTPNSTGFATVAGYFAAGDYIFYAIA
jgi:hypothetical protein